MKYLKSQFESEKLNQLDCYEIKGEKFILLRNEKDLFYLLDYFLIDEISNHYLRQNLLDYHIKGSLLNFFVPTYMLYELDFSQEEIIEVLQFLKNNCNKDRYATAIPGKSWEYVLVKVDDLLDII